MNLILVSDQDYIAPDQVCLQDRRFHHIRSVHRARTGDQLRIGKINGAMGSGKVFYIDDTRVELLLNLDQAPPAALPITLLLALPRPKMLKRVLQAVTSLGVKEIYLINSYRVDKSFWKSPLLSEEKLHEQLLLGLEQARDTLLPRVHLRPRFKPFVEDELPALCRDQVCLVAHPHGAEPCPHRIAEPTVLAIGPEGGFIDYEITKLREYQFRPVSLGARILRVETAVPVLLSRFHSS